MNICGACLLSVCGVFVHVTTCVIAEREARQPNHVALSLAYISNTYSTVGRSTADIKDQGTYIFKI